MLDSGIVCNGKALTEHIKYNLNNCTDIIVVMSENTRYSQWVPFEVGICEFGNNKIERSLETVNGKLQYSLIWYKGERKNIDISAFEKAMAAFTIEFMPNKPRMSI